MSPRARLVNQPQDLKHCTQLTLRYHAGLARLTRVRVTRAGVAFLTLAKLWWCSVTVALTAVTNYKGLTPLLCAIENDCSVGFLDFMLSVGADPNHASPSNLTPLISVCRHSTHPFEMVSRIVARGASLNAQVRYGQAMLI